MFHKDAKTQRWCHCYRKESILIDPQITIDSVGELSNPHCNYLDSSEISIVLIFLNHFIEFINAQSTTYSTHDTQICSNYMSSHQCQFEKIFVFFSNMNKCSTTREFKRNFDFSNYKR